MSLLEQMKIQAQKALETKTHAEVLSAETLASRNAKMKQIFDYWREFSQLIKTIEPTFEHSMMLPNVGEMSGLKIVEPFSDYRNNELNHQEFSDEINHVSFHFFYKAPRKFKFKRELGIADRVKEVLWRYSIVNAQEEIKNEQNRVIEIEFTIPWAVKGSAIFTPLPNKPVLHIVIKNFAKLGDFVFEMPFEQVDSNFLDELCKLLMGHENQFWKLAKF